MASNLVGCEAKRRDGFVLPPGDFTVAADEDANALGSVLVGSIMLLVSLLKHVRGSYLQLVQVLRSQQCLSWQAHLIEVSIFESMTLQACYLPKVNHPSFAYKIAFAARCSV